MAEQRETRHGVGLSSLDTEAFDGAGVTKRVLIDYLEAMADRLLSQLRDRPLSVIRARPGAEPFMQKNLPRHAPDRIRTTGIWSAASHREVHYPLLDDLAGLLWFGNQRAVEFHPTLWRLGEDGDPAGMSDLIIDLDPPAGEDPAAGFAAAVRAAAAVRGALDDLGLTAQIKTSGAKGLHIVVPIAEDHRIDDVAAATRALAARSERADPAIGTTEYVKERREGKVFLDATRAGGATVVAAYSPRARPGVPVSFPVRWDDLADIAPSDFTVAGVPALLGSSDPWREGRGPAQQLPAALIAEGHEIPIARVAAMHEGKRRKRERDGR